MDKGIFRLPSTYSLCKNFAVVSFRQTSHSCKLSSSFLNTFAYFKSSRIDLNLLHYSALNKFCDDFRKLKSSLSNRITVTDFNDDIITDNRLISKKVQAAADTIIREYYRNKPLTCFVHLKKMKNLTKEALTDAILLNSSLDEINSQLDNITPTPRDTSKTKTKKPSSS